MTTACGTSYSYDANGRMITRGSGEIDWTSYDLPSRIDNLADTSYSQFWYGPDRTRYKQYQSDTGATITYVGQLFEYEDTASTDTARYYVHTGTRAVAMVERVSGSNTTQYLHRDHQGSVTKVTSSGGSVTQSLAFDAWGLRRNASNWSALGSPFSGSHETERGYTGHEHLDNVGLIHMNGRVQDPALGRFVSADPIVQAPYLTQSHNRYSYVWNNPVSMIDPSGFQALSMVHPYEISYPGHDRFMSDLNAVIEAHPIADITVMWEDFDADGGSLGWNSQEITAYGHFAVESPPDATDASLRFDLHMGLDHAQLLLDRTAHLFHSVQSRTLTQDQANWIQMQQALQYKDPGMSLYYGAIELAAGGMAVKAAIGAGAAIWSMRGGTAAGAGSSLGTFFYDARPFPAISREYWAANGPAAGRSLHHWLIPQRADWVPAGVRNAGFNLLELPALRGVFHPSLSLNTWMGFARNWGAASAREAALVEGTLRLGVPAAAGAGGYAGYELGTALGGP